MEAVVFRKLDSEPLPPRFFSALVLGGLLGGALTPIWISICVRSFETLAAFPIVAPVAAVIWLLGLLFVGVPAWLVLHRLGFRTALAAVGLSLIALSPAFFVGSLEVPSLINSAAFVAMGPVVGLVIWRIAYGRRAS